MGKAPGGGVKIPTRMFPRERRVGLACKIAKWKTGGMRFRKSNLDKAKMAKIGTSKIAKSIEIAGFLKI